MESPKSTKSGLNYCSMTTPKAAKKLYWPKNNERESPKMCGYNEKQEEFGWGDSPEPLKIDPKFITGHSKKRLDCLESPVSTHSKRKILNPRPALQQNSSPNAADTDLARIQEINRQILAARTDSNATVTVNRSSLPDAVSKNRNANNPPLSTLTNNESLDSALSTFFQEEDDMLLSQVDFMPEVNKTPNKTKFVKSLSDNQLDTPKRTCSSSPAGFRRNSSFQNSSSSSCSTSTNSDKKDDPQPLKKQKSFHSDIPKAQMKCSLEEIEKKRLEAKYRREIKEIERRKMEAQKRLYERRARTASANAMVKR